MNTAILNISAIAVIFSTSFFVGNINQSNESISSPTEIAYSSFENSDHPVFVEAKYIDGELIPVVNLPEFTVEADYNSSLRVHATINNGELIPTVMLPTLNIVSEI